MADAIAFSTDPLPPRERFEAWRQSGLEQAGIAQETDDGAADFSGAFRVSFKGSVARYDVRSDAVRMRRGRSEINRRPMGCYTIYREETDGEHFEFAKGELTLRRGQLLVADLDQPFAARPVSGESYRHRTLLVPKPLLDRYLPEHAGPFVGLLPVRPGIEGLATSVVEALWREWDDIPDAALTAATDAACRLIGLAFGAAAGDHAEAVRHGRLTQARRFIEQRLADPSLSAAQVAAALRISERALYALFEGSGATFAAYVRRRRLEECRAALIASPTRPVLDIALSWGFGSMPSFYRAFQSAFGLAPGDVRETPAFPSDAP